MWASQKKIIFLYTCMQNPRLRTVYRQRKQPLIALVRKIMGLGRKKMALGCKKKKIIFLYTCMQNPRLRTVDRQRKRPLLAPMRKIMGVGRKKWPLGV